MAHLLIADDQPHELDTLESMLTREGHRCTRARDGAEAIKRWRMERHDLVILDVRMPGMNGIKATARLKAVAEEQKAYVPILVVTALDDRESRLEAFDAGADDFLSKPVEDWELRARVRTFLRIQQQQRDTEEAYRKLREVEALREELIQLIVHDLKNPLAAMSSNLAFVGSRLSGDADGMDAVADCRDLASRLLRMVVVLLDVNRMEGGQLAPKIERHALQSLVEKSCRARAHEARQRSIDLTVTVDRRLEAGLDADLMARVIDNLLDNALQYTPTGGRIQVSAGAGPRGVRISVFNSGTPIPERDRERIFEKYVRAGDATRGRKGTHRGIGLYFCRLAVRAHRGEIFADDGDDEGARFCIDLPR